MKIIFALLPEKGHINPYIGPAQALQDLGYSVSVISNGDISAQIQAAGLEFHSDLLQNAEVVGPRPPKGKELVETVLDFEKQNAGILYFFVNAVEAQIEGYEVFFKNARPKLIVADPMNYAAIIAAEKLQIPWVGISSALNSVLPEDLESDVLKMVAALKPQRQALFKRHGVQIQFRAIDAISSRLNLTFASEDLVGRPPSEVQLVGASKPLRERGDEIALRPLPADKTVIYASFGSQVYYFPEVFRKICAAAKELGVFLILSLGDLIDETEWQREPEHAHFYRYTPQAQVLKRAAAFITHGGANSVMEGLCAEVPMLISAVCNDQPHQSYFVERARVGIALDLKTAPVETIVSTLRGLLVDQALRERISLVSKGYKANGAILAAERISRILQGL